LATLVGYSQFVLAGMNALLLLSFASRFAAECSDAQFQCFAEHVVRVAELMQQPRRHEDVALNAEALFVDALRLAVAKAAANGLHTRLVQLLVGAWQRLQRSNVLQARNIEERIQSNARTQANLKVAINSSLAAPGLRRCALPGCGAKEAHPAHFKCCAACRAVVYCGREHQAAGWASHKQACKAARTKAAAEDEAGPSGA
jgi:hypothetical protein